VRESLRRERREILTRPSSFANDGGSGHFGSGSGTRAAATASAAAATGSISNGQTTFRTRYSKAK